MKWALSRIDRNHHSIDQFRKEMDDLFENFFSLAPVNLFASEWVPSIDLADEGKELHVKADMPGLQEKDIELTLENNILTISGEKREEREEKSEGKNILISERRFGSFKRSIRLPEGVRSEDISAEFKNGVLSVRIPKDENTSSKRIEIKAH